MSIEEQRQALEASGYAFDTGRLDGGILYEDVSAFPVIDNVGCAVSRRLSEAHAHDGEKIGLLYIVGPNINIAYNPAEYEDNKPAAYLVTRLAYLCEESSMYFWERMVANLNFPVAWRVFSSRELAIDWLHARNWPPGHGGTKQEISNKPE